MCEGVDCRIRKRTYEYVGVSIGGVRSQSISKDQQQGLYWEAMSVRVLWVARDIKPKREIVGNCWLTLASGMA